MSLSKEGQKIARVEAVCRQRTPLEFVAAWDTFRRLYLMTTPAGFFYHNFKPSPPFHYQMIYDLGAYGRNMAAAPRGFAKSIVIGTEAPLFLAVTRPNLRIAICMATDEMVEARLAAIEKQLVENEYLLHDFGAMKPKRGSGIWNKKRLMLANGSMIFGMSVTGRKRGGRPDILILDDPEYDDHTNSETAGLVSREKFENLMFQQIIPMLEQGSGIFWVGTVIGKQSFLSYALGDEDKRFQYWNKKHYKAGDPDAQDPAKRELLWESNWDTEALRIRKAEIGPEAFAREYQNEVGSGADKSFTLDPKKNYYLVEDPDEIYMSEPLRSPTKIRTNILQPDKNWAWVKTDFEARQLFNQLYVVVTVDSAKTVTRHSDYSCVCVSGFDSSNCLWILDMWLGRCPKEQLLGHIFRLGFKWGARVIGVESCSTQIELYDSCKTMMEEKKICGWAPRVMPVDYTETKDRTKKGQRIATLEWRFSRGKIKIPANWLSEWPWKELIAEINDFTYDLGMLAHDDAIDTVAMTHYVVHGQGNNEPPPPPRQTLSQQIETGDLWVAGGVPRLSAFNANELSMDILEAIVRRAYHTGHNGHFAPAMARKPYIVPRPHRIRDARGYPYGTTNGVDLVSVGGRIVPRASGAGANRQHPNLASAFVRQSLE